MNQRIANIIFSANLENENICKSLLDVSFKLMCKKNRCYYNGVMLYFYVSYSNYSY
jgi:hypothetical protein